MLNKIKQEILKDWDEFYQEFGGHLTGKDFRAYLSQAIDKSVKEVLRGVEINDGVYCESEKIPTKEDLINRIAGLLEDLKYQLQHDEHNKFLKGNLC